MFWILILLKYQFAVDWFNPAGFYLQSAVILRVHVINTGPQHHRSYAELNSWYEFFSVNIHPSFPL